MMPLRRAKGELPITPLPSTLVLKALFWRSGRGFLQEEVLVNCYGISNPRWPRAASTHPRGFARGCGAARPERSAAVGVGLRRAPRTEPLLPRVGRAWRFRSAAYQLRLASRRDVGGPPGRARARRSRRLRAD